MMATVRFEEVEGKTGGRLGVYERKSFTCRLPLGYIDYENDEEKEVLRRIFLRDRPDVEVIGMEVTIGNFVDIYFKK
jgi:hypothetical protein